MTTKTKTHEFTTQPDDEALSEIWDEGDDSFHQVLKVRGNVAVLGWVDPDPDPNGIEPFESGLVQVHGPGSSEYSELTGLDGPGEIDIQEKVDWIMGEDPETYRDLVARSSVFEGWLRDKGLPTTGAMKAIAIARLLAGETLDDLVLDPDAEYVEPDRDEMIDEDDLIEAVVARISPMVVLAKRNDHDGQYQLAEADEADHAIEIMEKDVARILGDIWIHFESWQKHGHNPSYRIDRAFERAQRLMENGTTVTTNQLVQWAAEEVVLMELEEANQIITGDVWITHTQGYHLCEKTGEWRQQGDDEVIGGCIGLQWAEESVVQQVDKSLAAIADDDIKEAA